MCRTTAQICSLSQSVHKGASHVPIAPDSPCAPFHSWVRQSAVQSRASHSPVEQNVHSLCKIYMRIKSFVLNDLQTKSAKSFVFICKFYRVNFNTLVCFQRLTVARRLHYGLTFAHEIPAETTGRAANRQAETNCRVLGANITESGRSEQQATLQSVSTSFPRSSAVGWRKANRKHDRR